jgi:acetoin utilization deacetylase AcuC-like enzyme
MYIIYTEKHQLHSTDQIILDGNPFLTEEVPQRAEILLKALLDAKFGDVLPPHDHGIEPLLAIHPADYLNFLREIYAASAAHYGTPEPVFTWTFATRYAGRRPESLLAQKGYYAFSWGTPILEGTYEAAYWSAQCALTAADLLLRDQSAAYALCRPPGHHAGRDLYGGFCYLNNVAIAARYIQKHSATSRIAILDIDFHHGNGTQTIFYQDSTVLYCSLHADPAIEYPYFWGAAEERGEGAGKGFNHNWPLPPGTEDGPYLAALEDALVTIRAYRPKYLLLSAGFDITAGDPAGGFLVTRAGLSQIAERIADLNLPTLILQEGGYHLSHLGEDAVTFLRPFSQY